MQPIAVTLESFEVRRRVFVRAVSLLDPTGQEVLNYRYIFLRGEKPRENVVHQSSASVADKHVQNALNLVQSFLCLRVKTTKPYRRAKATQNRGVMYTVFILRFAAGGKNPVYLVLQNLLKYVLVQ